MLGRPVDKIIGIWAFPEDENNPAAGEEYVFVDIGNLEHLAERLGLEVQDLTEIHSRNNESKKRDVQQISTGLLLGYFRGKPREQRAGYFYPSSEAIRLAQERQRKSK